jgi:uncharacterized protein DUF433
MSQQELLRRVVSVLEYLASGMSEQILADFPDLTSEDIRACLAGGKAAKGGAGKASVRKGYAPAGAWEK